MKLNTIIFRNTKIGCFTTPEFTDVEPEKAAIQLARQLKLTEDVAVEKKFANLEMYCLGTFDDETGVPEWHQPRLLLKCGDVLAKKGVVENGESVPTSKESA